MISKHVKWSDNQSNLSDRQTGVQSFKPILYISYYIITTWDIDSKEINKVSDLANSDQMLISS